MSKNLLEVFQKDKVLSPQQAQEVFQLAERQGRHILDIVFEKKYLTELKALQYLSQKYSLPIVNLNKYDIQIDVIQSIPADLALKYQLLPLHKSKGQLVVAIADPTVMLHIDDIKFHTKLNVEVVLCGYNALKQALDKHYGSQAFMANAIGAFEAQVQETGEKFEVDRQEAIEVDVSSSGEDAPVIALVNNILVEGIKRGASDIHVESYEKRSRVRLRIDGVLQEVIQIPQTMRRPLIARLKIMSKMDIAESRIPQDGRIKIRIGSGEMDFRVSTMPCLYGEKVVLRILSQGAITYKLTKLNFDSRSFEIFKKGIYSPNGMVLVTGPTGSGKTTTLYSALSELNTGDVNISTAEDPVEYNFEGINQVQVNKEIGLTFPSVLRTFLRQDPDIILVGEIRDYETAEVAIQAALTGHLVLSTVHTNDAPSTVTRLINMGVEPFLIASSINTIVAQRLIRTICQKCREELPLNREQLTKLGLAHLQNFKAFRGRGCQDCHKTGYKGRLAIYEVLEMTTKIKEFILSGSTAIELKKEALAQGMTTLRVAALQKVMEGVTSLEEALSSTQGD